MVTKRKEAWGEPSIAEVLQMVHEAKTAPEKKKILAQFSSAPLQEVLQQTYDPMIEFCCKIPKYRKNTAEMGGIPGLTFSQLHQAVSYTHLTLPTNREV